MLEFLSISKCSWVLVEMCLQFSPTWLALQLAKGNLSITKDYRSYGSLYLVENRDTNLNVLTRTLKLGLLLQKFLVSFSNLSWVTLESFPMKGNSKYQIFCLVLLGSVSLGIFMILLLKYLLTVKLVKLLLLTAIC